MRLSVCQGEALRLCASCARNVDNHPPVPPKDDYRSWIQPVTSGERCRDWYPLPHKPPTT